MLQSSFPISLSRVWHVPDHNTDCSCYLQLLHCWVFDHFSCQVPTDSQVWVAEILKLKGLQVHCKNYFNHLKHIIIMILQFRLRHLYPYLPIRTRSSRKFYTAVRKEPEAWSSVVWLYRSHKGNMIFFFLIIFVIRCSNHKKCTSQKSRSSICLSVIPQVLRYVWSKWKQNNLFCKVSGIH